MFEKLSKTEKRFEELEHLLADQSIASDKAQYQKLAKELSDIAPLVNGLREHRKIVEQITDLKKLLKEKHDPDFEDLAKSELAIFEGRKKELESGLHQLLNAEKKEADKNIIIEIRAGTGGAEASLFVGDLFRMYSKYAAQKNWNAEIMSSHPAEAGGFKEVIFGVSGKGASRRLKWESGVHRVQRVPTTEASGRIHTSAATVAVLFEPEEVELAIDPKDLRIDVYRSSGPGGQSVNTTDSAIRITHLPTGVVVTCQDERSQLKNKMKAMRVLRARLLDKMHQEALAKATQERRSKIGTGDRSEKIRTYNFPDRRITDHRIGFTTHQLVKMMDGDLDELTDALLKAEEEAEHKPQ